MKNNVGTVCNQNNNNCKGLEADDCKYINGMNVI